MHNLATHEISPGFLKGFINDDLIIELVKTYIDFSKPMAGIIKDDYKKEEYDPIVTLSDYLQELGEAEIIEISEDDVESVFIYRNNDTTVMFAMRANWTVAVWNKNIE